MSTLTKPLLCCDMDGVIAEADGPLLAKINAEFGTDFHPRQITGWAIEELIGNVVPDANTYIWSTFSDPDFIASQPLVLPAKIFLRKAYQHFRGVEIVTSRPESIRAETAGWLDHYGIPYTRLVHTKNKGEYCQQAGARYMIEDAPHHAEDVHRYGVGVFLIDKPYNQHVEARGGLWRVTSPTDILPILLEDLKRPLTANVN